MISTDRKKKEKALSRKSLFRPVLAGFLAICLLLSRPLVVQADEKEERIAAHQAMAVQSNEIAGWPTGPVVSAESAILIEAETGTILYAKNIHKQQFPASTTKILTALLAYENSSLDEVVTFSHDDVFGIPRNSNHIAMDVGDSLSMEVCLNALLIRSANEVAYAIAAHVGGSWDGFVEMMNAKAKELGAVDSHFANPNGLPNEEHVTSAYDLAMIGRAFFANEYLTKITMTPKLVVPKEKGDLVEWNKMGLIPTGSYAYEYLAGCKTGYTDSARSTLVSCAEKNGMRLICVVLNDENPEHNLDTIALFEYGFNNFKKVNVSQTETKYDIDNIGMFYSNDGIFGESKPLLSLNRNDCIIQPASVPFEELTSSISYGSTVPGQAALITYSYHGVNLGTVSLDINASDEPGYSFESEENPSGANTTSETKNSENKDSTKENTAKTAESSKKEKGPLTISINPKIIWRILGALAVLAVILGIIWFVRKNFQISFSLGSLIRERRPLGRRRSNSDRGGLRASNEIARMHKAQIRAAKRRYKERSRRH